MLPACECRFGLDELSSELELELELELDAVFLGCLVVIARCLGLLELELY